MSRASFALLAASVTVGGLVVVVWAARLIARKVPFRKPLVAGACLLGYIALLVVRPPGWVAIDLGVLAGAVGGVVLIESGLQSPGAVVMFLAVAAVVDVLSMGGGLSRLLVDRYREGTSNFLLYLTLVVPVRDRAIPIVGIGDLLVGGAAAAALLRLGLRPSAVFGALAAGLLVALACGLWRGGAPALPFIAVAVLVLVRRNQATPAPLPPGRRPRERRG